MSEKGLAVTVKVRREDGRVEQVRVGTAYRSGNSFRVRFAEMTIGDTGAVQSVAAAPETEQLTVKPMTVSPPAALAIASGEPASIRRLEYIAERARKNLANPAKARWHEDERALLQETEAELARQRGLTFRAESRGERGAA